MTRAQIFDLLKANIHTVIPRARGLRINVHVPRTGSLTPTDGTASLLAVPSVKDHEWMWKHPFRSTRMWEFQSRVSLSIWTP
jgi:hypothetical protein